MKSWLRLLARMAPALLVSSLPACVGDGAVEAPTAPLPMTAERWASSDDLRITINAQGQPSRHLTTGFEDFKPSWSVSDGMLTFFRRLRGGPTFDAWRTKICVINTDGTGFRELTSGEHPDFNQTWTRDGTNQVIFNRYAIRGPETNDVYLVDPTGSIGDEIRVSNPEHTFEWAMSGLRDGRIFVDRIDFQAPGGPLTRSFLLTPRPGGVGRYEEITRPTTQIWHKLSVSPSETRVCYMLDNDASIPSYEDAVLYYADLDLDTLTVSNPVAITDDDIGSVYEYPRWNADESLIIYDSNRSGVYQLYAYRLADGVTGRISADARISTQFGNFEACPK